MDSLEKTEPYELGVSFEPKQLAEKPVRVDEDGKTIKIMSVTFDEPLNEASPKNEKHATILLEAYLKDISYINVADTILMDDDTDKIINRFGWTIKDEKGKIYNVTGGNFKMIGKDEQGRNHIRIKLQSDEMKELPQKLSLTSELAKRAMTWIGKYHCQCQKKTNKKSESGKSWPFNSLTVSGSSRSSLFN